MYQYLLIFIVAGLFVFIVDTFSIDVIDTDHVYPLPDHEGYLAMIEGGGYTDSIAPFAYRFGYTSIASVISKIGNLSPYDSFKLLTNIAIALEFVLCYALVRLITKEFIIGISLLAILAFSFFNIRYYIFNPMHSDPVGFVFLFACFILIYRDNLLLAGIVAIVGITVREFLVAPLASIAILYLWEYSQTKKWDNIAKILLLVVLSGLVVILPRLLIEVDISHTFLDSPKVLLKVWTNPLRLMNIFIAFSGQMLPIILLMTAKRWQAIKNAPKKVIIPIIPYSIMVLILALYGGTDASRFMSYLIIPELILLSIMLEEDFNILEVLFVMVAWFAYFPFWQPAPQTKYELMGYIGPYFHNIRKTSIIRILVMAFSMIGMDYLRRFINRNDETEESD